jgi:prepilin-type processing-associated H-X9-DG protein
VGRTASSDTGFSDYQYNGMFDGLRVAKIPSASLTIIATEGIPSNAGQTQSGCGLIQTNCTSGLASIYTDVGATGASGEARHLGGLNVVFSDGHTKWYKLAPGVVIQVYNASYSYQGYKAETIYNCGAAASVYLNNPTFSIKP